jgi:hypothetical protein
MSIEVSQEVRDLLDDLKLRTDFDTDDEAIRFILFAEL